MNEDSDYPWNRSEFYPLFVGLLFWALAGLLFFVLILGEILGFDQNKPETCGYRDTIAFMDKDTDKVVRQLENVEFVGLGKGSFICQIKDGEKEILLFEEIPPNTYPTILKIEKR